MPNDVCGLFSTLLILTLILYVACIPVRGSSWLILLGNHVFYTIWKQISRGLETFIRASFLVL
ncbi:hypothetical protein BJX64DRAFT_257299 [Aspergillus heterothallicus]